MGTDVQLYFGTIKLFEAQQQQSGVKSEAEMLNAAHTHVRVQ